MLSVSRLALGRSAAGQIVGFKASLDNRSLLPFRKTVIQDDSEKLYDDVEGSPPEDLFPAVRVMMDEARILKRFLPVRTAGVNLITAEVLLLVEGRKGDFNDLFDLPVRMKQPGVSHKTGDRKDRPPEKDQFVRGEGAQKKDAGRGKADLFPGFAEGVCQEKRDESEGIRILRNCIFACIPAKNGKRSMGQQGSQNTIENRMKHPPRKAQVSRLGNTVGAFNQLKQE